MSTQLDIVDKLKEALQAGNPELATPFMADDFTHQVLPAWYVSSAASALNVGIGADIDGSLTRLGAPRRTTDQWKALVVEVNTGLKSLKVKKSTFRAGNGNKNTLNDSAVRNSQYH